MRPTTIPPVHLLAAAIFAIAAPFLVPTAFFGASISLGTGAAILGVGFCLVARTHRIMTGRGTTQQFDATTQLIEDDVFRYSRNPMYLGMTLMLLGLALAVRNFVSLAAPIYFFFVIDRIFAPYEETKLQKEIGEAYIDYRRKVRRWL